MTADVVFVASSNTHIEQVLPVIVALERRGVRVTCGGLDEVYAQGASARAAQLGLPIASFLPPLALPVPFYRRSPLLIWGDVLRCRPHARAWLRRHRPAVVVVLNDRGLVEKLLIHLAHARGARVVLLQDGMLGPLHGAEGTADRVRRAGKRLGSALLRAVGADYLAASAYGQGGADLVCANGSAGAAALVAAGVPAERVVVTGQPRYDTLPSPSPAVAPRVIAFTTPFANAGLGVAAQRRQVLLVAALATELGDRGVDFLVKPHPRESRDLYVGALGEARVLDGSSTGALADCSVAILGSSTVMDEAGLMGVPVIVPGRVVHGDRFEANLPPSVAYPRFETAGDGARLAVDLLGGAERERVLAAQRAIALTRVSLDPARPAAERTADAICSFVPCTR